MANGYPEIHNPFSKHNGGTDCDPETTSDLESLEDSVEFRLMMAYAKRRRPNPEVQTHPQDGETAGRDSTGKTLTSIEEEKETKEQRTKKKKKKKVWKRVPSIFRCIKPQTEDGEPQEPVGRQHDVTNKSFHSEPDDAGETDELETLASRLVELADDIPFTPPEVEADNEGNEVERMIGLLLRDAGDKLNETELKKHNIGVELFLNYTFFKELITQLLRRMGLRSADPEAPGPQASSQTQIAVTCEVTHRLSAVNTLPTDRLLTHGARYLQDYYSTWARQQGGYEAAFDSDDEEVQ
ncbi:apoptosis facilitator Bcl-2-like protein 14 [Embiotoca jacksoni]|uniref:apoptosis facilitator Bcl-2-like protein 14 n=1 Tax=Embiotoca jacksoni TaxID=100190 RepID=UPI003703FC00